MKKAGIYRVYPKFYPVKPHIFKVNKVTLKNEKKFNIKSKTQHSIA